MAQVTREWVDFFLQAGIPAEEAASYALIFARNRIQKNMLIDLNKEYLKDMGITLLGDVIAILKHAKAVHETNNRAWVMSESEENKIEKEADENPSKNSPQQKSSTTVKRLLDHYTRKYKEAEESLSVIPKSHIDDKEYNKKQQLASIGVENTDKNLVRIKKPVTTSKMEVPLQKKIRVPPEQEVTSKITLPKASDIKNALHMEKKTVFSRLGDGLESITAPNVPTPVKKLPSSIFSRLGDVSSPTAPIKKTKALQYAGVFKTASKPGTPPDSLPSSKPIATDVQKQTVKGFRESDLKMLKITTEFSDNDEVEAPNNELQKKRKIPQFRPNPVVKRPRPIEIEIDEKSTNVSPPKRVHFGGTSVCQSTSKSVFAKYTIVNKQVAAKGGISTGIAKKEDAVNVKARIGIVKPRLATPISKMVSDTMVTKTIKSRIDLKGKNSKGGILARLG